MSDITRNNDFNVAKFNFAEELTRDNARQFGELCNCPPGSLDKIISSNDPGRAMLDWMLDNSYLVEGDTSFLYQLCNRVSPGVLVPRFLECFGPITAECLRVPAKRKQLASELYDWKSVAQRLNMSVSTVYDATASIGPVTPIAYSRSFLRLLEQQMTPPNVLRAAFKEAGRSDLAHKYIGVNDNRAVEHQLPPVPSVSYSQSVTTPTMPTQTSVNPPSVQTMPTQTQQSLQRIDFNKLSMEAVFTAIVEHPELEDFQAKASHRRADCANAFRKPDVREEYVAKLVERYGDKFQDLETQNVTGETFFANVLKFLTAKRFRKVFCELDLGSGKLRNYLEQIESEVNKALKDAFKQERSERAQELTFFKQLRRILGEKKYKLKPAQLESLVRMARENDLASMDEFWEVILGDIKSKELGIAPVLREKMQKQAPGASNVNKTSSKKASKGAGIDDFSSDED